MRALFSTRIVAVALALLASILGCALAYASEEDRGILASLISRALSKPGMEVSIGAVDGALSSNATIRGIVIADKNGPWLRLDRARIVWTRSALLLRRLSISDLEIGHLEFIRKPVASTTAPSTPASNDPILPELPVKVEIAKFTLADFDLGAEVAGVAAHLAASGKASLGKPSEGLDLTFDARRTDAIGTAGIRVSFIPDTSALRLNVDLHEAAGGLLSHLASIPGTPPIDLTLSGDGKLDAFAAKLDFSAGPAIGAVGTAQLARQGGERVLTLDTAARISGLMPATIAPVFAGDTRLAGAVHIGDDYAVRTENLGIVATAARLDIDANVGADRSLNARVVARTLDEKGGVHVPGADIRVLRLEASALGALDMPRLAAQFRLEDARLSVGHFGHVDAQFTASPNGPFSDSTTRIDLIGDAEASDIAFADGALARAIGNRTKLTLRGRATTEGVVDVSVLRLDGATGAASFNGTIGRQILAGHADVNLPSLAAFADLAGIDLRGTARLGADLNGNPSASEITATLNGAADRLATGIAALDGLLGGHAEIRGGVRTLADGYGFSDLVVSGRGITARLNGNATSDTADIPFSVDIPDARRASAQLTGHAAATGRLTGSLQHPGVTLLVSLDGATALGRPIPHFSIDARATDLTGALNAQATLDGIVGGKAAGGSIAVSRLPDNGGWRLASSDLRVGSVVLAGDAALDAAKLANGQLTIKADDLDDLSPLLLQKLSGRVNAALTFAAPNGRQSVGVSAHGGGIRASVATIDRFDVEARVEDVYNVPIIDGTAAVDRADVAGEVLSKLRAQAKGSPQGSDLSLSAALRGFDIASRGRLVAGDRPRLDLAQLDAVHGQTRFGLAGPATISFPVGGLDIRNFALKAGSGRLSANGLISKQRLDLVVTAAAVPLSLADLASPNLALEGTLDANATITGTSDALRGNWRFKVARLVASQTRSAGIGPIDIAGSGRLAEGRSSIDASVTIPRAGTLRVDGSVPLTADGPLDVSVRGTLDAAIANAVLSAGGRSASGQLSIDARAQGTIARPRLGGSAALRAGTFYDPVAGLRLDRIEAVVRAQGEQITIERASAATPNGGAITLSGNVKVAPDAGFPADIRIGARNAQLASNEIVTAVGDLALQISGPVARRPRVTGRITLASMDVRVPNRLPGSYQPLPGTRHVRPPPQTVRRLAVARKAGAAKARGPAFDADLNLVLSAPSQIYVRGRGIDAELGGDLTVTGTLDKPAAKGGFQLRRGTLTVVSQRLDFTRGIVTFNGNVTPDLDFVAETTAGDVTARVSVSGNASQPTFAFSSSPSLPQDEVISRLLFARASGSLSPVQAIQLAQTVSEFSGNGGGPTDGIRKALGADALDLRLGSGGPGLGASRYISRNVHLDVRTGVTPTDTGAGVSIDITRRIRARGEVGANGNASAGIAAEWEFGGKGAP